MYDSVQLQKWNVDKKVHVGDKVNSKYSFDQKRTCIKNGTGIKVIDKVHIQNSPNFK